MGIVSSLALSVIASQCQLSQRESLWQGNRKQVLKAGAVLAPPLGELARERLRGRRPLTRKQGYRTDKLRSSLASKIQK